MTIFFKNRAALARWRLGMMSTMLTLCAGVGALSVVPLDLASMFSEARVASLTATAAPAPSAIAPRVDSRPPLQPRAVAPASSQMAQTEIDLPAPQSALAAPVEPRLRGTAASARLRLGAPTPRPAPRPAPSVQDPVQDPVQEASRQPEPSAKPPKRISQTPLNPKPPRLRALKNASGPACEDARIKGAMLESIVDGGGCILAAPVSIQSASGVTLRPKAVNSCEVAGTLSTWIEKDLQPAAIATFGQKVAKIHQVSAYVCRNRYAAADAKLSFHATGDALDIASFELEDGSRVSVLADWGGEGPKGPEGAAFLRAAWTSACGPFGTVLGPEANAAHRDHFHFDVAKRRNAYCE